MNEFDNIPLVKLYMANLKQEKTQNNNIQPKKASKYQQNHFYSIYFVYFEDIR